MRLESMFFVVSETAFGDPQPGAIAEHQHGAMIPSAKRGIYIRALTHSGFGLWNFGKGMLPKLPGAGHQAPKTNVKNSRCR